MPVIACPKCQGKLKLPDNMEPRRVKCPNCAAVFMSNEAPAANGAAPPPAAKRKPAPGAAESKAPQRGGPEKDFDFDDNEEDRRPRPRRERDDEDDDDRPRRRRRDDDDEEEDRPRARRRRDDEEDDRPRRRREDDEEEDRPRARRRRDEDDEEEERPRARRRRGDDEDDHDEEDRPRSRRRREEDDDYEEDPRTAKKRAQTQLSRAETATLLNFIATWLAAASVGAMGLGLLLFFLGIIDFLRVMGIIGGIAGWGALITAAVGYGFAIAGPKKDGAIGLSIATAAVTGVYLILLIVQVTQSGGGVGDGGLGGGRRAAAAPGVGPLTSGGDFLTAGNLISPGLSFHGMILGTGVVSAFPIMGFLMILLEVSRFILFFLFLKAVAGMVKDRGAAGSCKGWVITYSAVVGGLLVVGVLTGLIAQAVSPQGGGARALMIILIILSFGSVCAVLCWGALIVGKVRDSLRWR